MSEMMEPAPEVIAPPRLVMSEINESIPCPAARAAGATMRKRVSCIVMFALMCCCGLLM